MVGLDLHQFFMKVKSCRRSKSVGIDLLNLYDIRIFEKQIFGNGTFGYESVMLEPQEIQLLTTMHGRGLGFGGIPSSNF